MWDRVSTIFILLVVCFFYCYLALNLGEGGCEWLKKTLSTLVGLLTERAA